MKWVSLLFCVFGVIALGVAGYVFQDILAMPEFKFILLASQVQVGPSDVSEARQGLSGLVWLKFLPSFAYAGAALSAAGGGLVVTKGRVAAIPLLVAAVLLLLPLGLVVHSVPDLVPYLDAGYLGIPSFLAALAALFVRRKVRALSPRVGEAPVAESQTVAPQGSDAQGAEKKARVSKKQLWLGGGAAVAIGLVVLLLTGLLGRGTGEDEVLFHPGPVALWSNDLLSLAEGPLQPNQIVAAEWDGAWFAGRVLSAGVDSARIRFLGWESAWDADLSRDRLRSLPVQRVPKAPDSKLARDALGASSSTPCAFVLSLYQPDAGLEGVARLSDLPAKQTLYAQRLDLEDISLERALAGSPIQSGKPFALVAAGTLGVKAAGAYYFALASNGTTRLWVDDQPVTPDSPVQLDAGAHEVRVEHRHGGGASLTLRLRMGTQPGALRVLDLNRDGVAQFAREDDGRLRVVLDEGLLFDFDRDDLKPAAERTLSSIYYRSISPTPNAPVSIEGHTDDSGAAEHNLELSRRRAESVRAWLTAHGRTSSGLGIEPFGETRPRVPNDTDAHRGLNRRVELVIGGDDAKGEVTSPDATAAGTASPGTTAVAPTATAGDAIAVGASKQPVLDVLHAYYRELNDGHFDANRYFEPSVDRYITMVNTSTAAMNNYIWNVFPKQFKEHHFEAEDDSLSAESAGEYVYVERSRYIQAGKQKSVEKRVKVRIRLSPAGKLVFLQQFQRL